MTTIDLGEMTTLKKEHWDLLLFVRDGARRPGERIQDGDAETLEGLLSLGAVRCIPCLKCLAGGDDFHTHYGLTYFGLRLLRAHEETPPVQASPMEGYFVVRSGESGTKIEGPFSKEDLERKLQPNKFGETHWGPNLLYLHQVPSSSDGFWDIPEGKNPILIIKGEIIVPQAEEIVTRVSLR